VFCGMDGGIVLLRGKAAQCRLVECPWRHSAPSPDRELPAACHRKPEQCRVWSNKTGRASEEKQAWSGQVFFKSTFRRKIKSLLVEDKF
jgi:hypothetical protein